MARVDRVDLMSSVQNPGKKTGIQSRFILKTFNAKGTKRRQDKSKAGGKRRSGKVAKAFGSSYRSDILIAVSKEYVKMQVIIPGSDAAEK